MSQNCFIDSFDAIVKQHPKELAIEDCGQVINFLQLRLNALSFAFILKTRGIQKGDVIAIRMEKSSDYITSILACWYLGAVILPLDPEIPDERTAYILKDSGTKYLTGIDPYLSTEYSFSNKSKWVTKFKGVFYCPFSSTLLTSYV